MALEKKCLNCFNLRRKYQMGNHYVWCSLGKWDGLLNYIVFKELPTKNGVHKIAKECPDEFFKEEVLTVADNFAESKEEKDAEGNQKYLYDEHGNTSEKHHTVRLAGAGVGKNIMTGLEIDRY